MTREATHLTTCKKKALSATRIEILGLLQERLLVSQLVGQLISQ